MEKLNKLEKDYIKIVEKELKVEQRVIFGDGDTLGNIPLQALLHSDNAKIGEYHGKALNINGFLVFPLYHPASIIYNRSLHDTYIEDVKSLKEYIDNNRLGE